MEKSLVHYGMTKAQGRLIALLHIVRNILDTVRATVILEPNQCAKRTHFPALTTEEHYILRILQDN